MSKDETVLIRVQCISGTCVHEHISPLLGEHLRIVNIFLGPVTVHYREVSLYTSTLLNVVSPYDLSVLFMSVTGLQNKFG